jgi:hypothetical protein
LLKADLIAAPQSDARFNTRVQQLERLLSQFMSEHTRRESGHRYLTTSTSFTVVLTYFGPS